ncbi:flagellar hook-length control protein FliK [Gammaproteobacteria bacterium]|nr:flagellar hook-length control protein FliK [Gammaproteobacteria bacterium]
MNISSKYDLSDIVKELGSSNSAKASKAAGPEGVFSAILSDLAAAGITGKVAAEVAEAVESGSTPLSSPTNDLLAQLKAMQGEASTAARDSALESNSAIAATGLLAELRELQGLRKENFESDAGKASQSTIDRDIAATSAQGLIAFLQARLESSGVAVQSDAAGKSQSSSTQLTSEKQSNPFASLLTNDALRITKLKDSRAVLLGPNAASKPEEGASKLKDGASSRVENKLGSLLNQLSESAASKNDDSPEYWNRETARLLAEMGRGNGASEFIPDAPSASAKHIEASNSAPTNASAFSAQLASLNSAAANNATMVTDNASASSRASELSHASGLTRASELKNAVESTRSDSNAHIQNNKQVTTTGIESAAVTYAQAQRPARFDNIGLLGQTATESQAMSATNAQAVAQAKTEAGQANQQLSAQRGEQLAVSAAPIDAQLLEKAQQQRKALASSQEAGAIASTTKIKSEINTAALKQQFANIVVNEISTQSGNVNSPLQTNPLGTAFAPIVNQAKQARDNSPLTQESETEINLQELELGVSQGTNTKANEAANQRVSIANLPQGIASRINPHLAKGLGSGPTKISISLFPENYGQVDVEFVYSEEAGLRVSLSSESAETTRLLQSNSSGLRETLLGNSLADVSVDVNAHGQGKQEGSAENSQGAAAARQIAGESATEGEPLKSKATSDNSDGLDTYV